jgi:hypothetical protein
MFFSGRYEGTLDIHYRILFDLIVTKDNIGQFITESVLLVAI